MDKNEVPDRFSGPCSHQHKSHQMNRFLFLNLFLFFGLLCSAQMPAAGRLTDWKRAGNHSPSPVYSHIAFAGDPTGVNDNSAALQAILDTITNPAMILLDSGTYLFTTKITLKANTVLKGLGNKKTHLRFNQGSANQPSIEIRGTESGAFYNLIADAPVNQYFVQVSAANGNNFKAGDYFRMTMNDADLVNDAWAANRIGQMIRVDSVVAGKIYFSSPLRMDYPLSKTPRIRKAAMLRNSGIECLKISREDYSNSGSGSSNFDIRYVSDFHMRGVESFRCNYAHVEIMFSTNITIEENYFHDAHNFGDGGRAYGMMLHYSTGEVLVQNNVFRKLRHAMILQAGANGNVFAYNYAYEGRKEVFPGFFAEAEDMDCHGNYPFFNLFEGNYAQFGSVDDSHGKNGPYNTFFRNIATTSGFKVTSNVSPYQNFTANHSLNGTNTFNSTDHHITDNSWQGPGVLGSQSLLYTTPPAFLAGYGLGTIGPPLFNVMASIPARDRALAGNPINCHCEIIVWDGTKWAGGFAPSMNTAKYDLNILPGGNAVISRNSVISSLKVQPGANIEISKGVQLKINN